MNLPAGFPPEQARVFHVQQRIQTSAIIGCAIFEGAAFANTFAYMQSRDLVFLAMTGVLVVGILAHFSTLGSYLRRIEDELRRMDEEELLRRPGRSLSAFWLHVLAARARRAARIGPKY